jgi:hypothetical protein
MLNVLTVPLVPWGLAHKRKSRPMGIIERVRLEVTALCRKTSRPDVTTGLVGWKYAGKTD